MDTIQARLATTSDLIDAYCWNSDLADHHGKTREYKALFQCEQRITVIRRELQRRGVLQDD